MAEMTWEQKRDALESLCGTLHLLGFRDGRFYVSAYTEVAHRGLLTGTAASAPTMAEAVDEVWRNCTEIPDDACLYVSSIAQKNAGKRVRWNGFMWADL